MSKNTTNNKSQFRLKIFPRILLGYLIIPLIALIALFSLINNAKNDQTIAVEQNLITNSNLAVNQVDDWIDKNVRISKYVASLDGMASMEQSQQKPLLVAAKNATEWMTLMFATDRQGQAITRSDDKKLVNYSDREYFRDAIRTGVIGEQVLIGKTYPEPLHCFAVPINKNSEAKGVVTQCSRLLAVSENVTNIKLGQTGHAFLVDSKKRLIAHGSSNVDLKTKLADFKNNPALLENKVDDVFTFEEDGVKKIAYAKKAGLGWTLVLQQDYSEAFASVEKATLNAYIFLAGILLATIILSILLSRALSTPINAVAKSAVEISKGKLDKEVPGIERSDEIGELARSMARMKRSLSISLQRLKASQN